MNTQSSFIFLALLLAILIWRLLPNKKKKPHPEKEQPLDVENELQEVNRGYSTMALLIEEQRQLISDLQQHTDKLEQRLDCLERPLDMHLTLCQVPWSQENADGEEDEEESETPSLLKPLDEWLDSIQEELDKL